VRIPRATAASDPVVVVGTNDASALAVEHGALRAAASGLRGALEAKRCDCGSNGGCSCLRDRVDQLRRHLLQHFDAEEKLWSAIERDRADWATLRWIDRVEAEHERFRRLTAEARLGLAEPELAPDLRSKLRAILDDLLEHELSETKLFQRSVFESPIDPR